MKKYFQLVKRLKKACLPLTKITASKKINFKSVKKTMEVKEERVKYVENDKVVHYRTKRVFFYL